MKTIKKLIPAFVAALLAIVTVAPSSAAETIDKIVAVVGDYVILKSEVEFQAQLWLLQQGQQVSTKDIDKIKNDLTQQMVNDKLVLIKALKDTTISISSEQVESALDMKLEELKSRFPSQAEFDKQMLQEGLTYREIKNKFREEMRDQLYKDRLIARELSKISVAPSEVAEFFEQYKDSLPQHPDAVKLSHLLLEVKPGQSTLDSAKAQAEMVLELLDEGSDFAELAKEYSEDPSASSGGDLGYFGRGDLVEEFEKAAFALEIGETSDIVLTQYGYHIIRCMDKQAERIRCSHILFLTQPSQEDIQSVMRFADSLKSVAEDGEDFSALVKEYSIDEETRIQGGELGWFISSEMTPEFSVAVQGLEPGDISEPTKSQFGVHILKVLDKQVSRPWSMDEDRDRLKEFARRQKTEQVVNKLLDEMKKETYVEIRN
jgi:peptidyl-prolyl cis-trans isomerase SurA